MPLECMNRNQWPRPKPEEKDFDKESYLYWAAAWEHDRANAAEARLAEAEAQLKQYEDVIIPSWKREETMWHEDEANAIEFRRVLAEELDKRDATISQLRAWLRDYQPRAADSADAARCPCNCALPDPGKACAGCGRINDGDAQ